MTLADNSLSVENVLYGLPGCTYRMWLAASVVLTAARWYQLSFYLSQHGYRFWHFKRQQSM